MLRFLLVVLLVVSSGANAQPTRPKGKDYHRTVRAMDFQFIARLDIDPDSAEISTPDGSFKLSSRDLKFLVYDYAAHVASDKRLAPRFAIGPDADYFVLSIRQPQRILILALIVTLLSGALGAFVWRARRRIRHLHDERAQVLARRRMVEAGREEERQRLARELHDGPLQTLYALRMQMARMDADPVRQDTLIADATDHLRDLLEVLRAPLLAPYGLTDAVQNFATSYPGTDFQLDFEPGVEEALSATATNAVFRILQEAVSNAVRHGGATLVRATLHTHGQTAHLTIADNGSGFDASLPLEHYSRASHYGLVGMWERVEVLGGTVRIDSSPAGTTLHIQLPLPRAEDVEEGVGSFEMLEAS